MKPTKLTAGLAVLSIGNQGMVLPSVSTGRTRRPGKGVGDGIGVSVEVGSSVDVGVLVGAACSVAAIAVETMDSADRVAAGAVAT